MHDTVRKLTAEFVGAFTLIFIGAGSIVALATGFPGSGLITVALAHGLAIGVMVSAVGHVSGGHFNPAVTIGAWITQKISLLDAAGYPSSLSSPVGWSAPCCCACRCPPTPGARWDWGPPR